jgi:hypothetical protein
MSIYFISPWIVLRHYLAESLVSAKKFVGQSSLHMYIAGGISGLRSTYVFLRELRSLYKCLYTARPSTYDTMSPYL